MIGDHSMIIITIREFGSGLALKHTKTGPVQVIPFDGHSLSRLNLEFDSGPQCRPLLRGFKNKEIELDVGYKVFETQPNSSVMAH